MTKNTQQFQLAYITPIFHRDILLLIGSYSQNDFTQSNISNDIKLQCNNDKLN